MNEHLDTSIPPDESQQQFGAESLPQAESRSRLRSSRAALWMCGVVCACFALGAGLNYVLVGGPVARKLGADPRNAGYSLAAHYRYYFEPGTLVLDLRDVTGAAPLDLFRAVFQSAEALHEVGRRFDRVILARRGKPVFLMKGEDFWSIGAEFSAGQNPVYLVRTLPEKLYRPSGEAGFGRWEGGWLGVLEKQLNDANDAARQWSSGH